MSDTSLPAFIRFDTTANRMAFTPDPGAPEQLYIWLDSDDQPNAYYWDGATWQPLNAAVVGGITELTGNVTAGPGSGSQAATIANDAVTYAKIQNISAADRLLGRGNGGGSGDTQEIALGTNLSMSGTTLNASGGGGLAITAVVKASDETVNNSSSLQNDDELTLAVAINSVYIFELMLLVQNASSNTPDFKFAWAIPTSATVDEIGFGLDLAAAALTTLVAIAGSGFTAPVTASRAFGVFTGSSVCPVYVRGTLRTGSTSGNFQLQWAQSTADPTNTVVKAGSHLTLTKVS